MSSLRHRVFLSTGLLIGLQVLGTGLGFASWWQVHQACLHQQTLSTQRDAVLELAAAARESYVHEAHTFIEGGPAHLAHLAETSAAVDGRLAEVSRLGLPSGADLDAVRTAIAASNAWFGLEVAPRARAGELDRATAVLLHAEAERRAQVTEQAIASVLASISNAQAAEVADIGRHTSHAWIVVGLLTLGGAGLGTLIAGGLARSVLGPVGALQAAARSIARGEPARAPEDGDVELAELGHSFNAMVEQTRAAGQRRIQVERLAALGEMSSAVAHELLNPLAVILGHEGLHTPELAPVRAEAEHARRVVQGLLGFARPGEEPAERIDLTEAARTAVDRITPAADHRGIEVHLSSTGPVSLVASPSAVRQVIDNLLRNAVEASPPDTTVEIAVQPGPVLEVRDRGPGVPAAIRARLYEPFVTGRHEGTGLGLAICQRIVRAQGGTVARWEATHA
jgi:signal transduction histidine kinase